MVDPVTVTVVRHRLGAIVEAMGEAMLRTSYSQILDSSRDFFTGMRPPAGGPDGRADNASGSAT